MSKEDSYLSQNNILRCPYFGLIDDVRTQSDFPSEVNCCHRCKKPESPSYAHQQEFCLTKQYSSCIMLKDTRLKSLPADVRMSEVPTTNRNKNLINCIGVVLVALALILLISGPIKGIFYASSTPQFLKLLILSKPLQGLRTQACWSDNIYNKQPNAFKHTIAQADRFIY